MTCSLFRPRSLTRWVAVAALGIGFSHLQAQDLATGLVSYWPLDEVQGTKTPDRVSGYDMELSNLSADDLVPGQSGNAMAFDNARQTLLSRVHEAGEDLPANQHDSWTLSIWAQLDGNGQNDLRIFSEGNTEDSNPLFNLGTQNGGASGQLDVFIRNGVGGWPTVGHIFSEQEPFDGDWHHIVWVENAGERAIYIDGELDSLVIDARPDEGEFPVNNTSIGGILRASASHWVTGNLDEVAIWKRALSEDEIAEVRDNGLSSVFSPLGDGLVSYWPLDSVQGTKTPDLASGYDMELTNLSAADLVDGQQGKALAFDNARQTLLSRVHEAGEDLPANQHDSWTLSMWAQLDGNGQNDLRIFSEGNTEDSNPLFNLGTQNGGASGQLDVFIRNGVGGWPTVGHIFSEQEPFDGTWHHIVWVENGGERSIYIDGELDSLVIDPRPDEGDFPVNNTSIGGILRASASHWVTGNLDEVAIWKRALSEDEIVSVRDGGIGELFPPLARGLVSHWPLDEIQGTKTPDLVSGYDMDLTNLEAGDVVEGRNGNAFSFDNARQTLLSRVHEPGEALPANQHDSWTLTLWANLDGNGQNDLRIFSEGNTEDSNPLFNLGTQNAGSSGQLDVFIRNGVGGWPTVGHIFSEQEPFDGSWHHIAWVEDGGERAIYIDGELDSLVIDPRPDEGEFPVNNTSIGGILRASASHWVTGLLDDAAIWSRALSEEEIKDVIESGVPRVIKRAQPLFIRSFIADFPAVVKDDSVVLRWDASPDATLTINHSVGDVTAASQFGVGSATVTLEGSKTFVLTATRGSESISVETTVQALDGVADGWTMIDNFDAWPLGNINSQGSWKNPVGDAEVVEGPESQALTFLAGEALNALELKSLTLQEGEKATIFFRAFVDPESEFDGLQLNIGLSEKPIRFVGDFDNDVGPFVRFDNSEGFGVDVMATDGVGEGPEWIGETLLEGTTYNVWLDIDNQSVEDGDIFSIHLQEIGGERKTLAENFMSDRNPAGSADLGAVFPQLDTLFTVAFGGSESDGLVQFDDFYITNTGEFSEEIPVPVQATTFLAEIESPVVEPPVVDPPTPPTPPLPPVPGTGGEISGIVVNADGTATITFTGALLGSDTVTGPYEPVEGATSPFTIDTSAGEAQFYITD